MSIVNLKIIFVKKQRNVVYRQLVLQTVRSLRVVSLVFRGHARPPENRKH